MASRAMQELIAQFCGITGAPADQARRFLDKHKRLDAAVDAYYSGPAPAATPARAAAPSTAKITALFERYKAADGDADADVIAFDGTQALCDDLGVAPDDVVLLVLAFELGSPRLGEWPRKGWLDGWRALGVDTPDALKARLPALRARVRSEPAYFAKVYQHTFDFARAEGQRSLPMDSAKAFWEMLIPAGLAGGALSHIASVEDDDGDADMDAGGAGWSDALTAWWFDFLDEKGGKGVSKDTWSMFREFVRVIDARFEKYDVDAAWPSTIDDFVEYAKERLAREG